MGINKEPHHTQEVIKPESLAAEQSTSPQQEEDDEDDGPPPGFDSIPVNLSTHKKESKSPQQVEDDGDDDDDDGPPPGFQLIATKIEKSYQEEDDDGPPPGFEDDDVAIPNSHSIPTVDAEIENGLNPKCNSQPGGDGSEKLGFQPISVKDEEREGDDDVSMPNSHSVSVPEGDIEVGLNPNWNYESVSGYGFETLGIRPVIVREQEREGDGFELGFQSREEKRERDGSGLGLQSFSVKNEEKITDGSGLGLHSVHEGEREYDEFELGSQSVPVKEGEKEHSISEKEEYDDNEDEGPPPGWDSFPPPRQATESPAPPHVPPSAFSCGIDFQSTHVKEEEKVGDEFELGSQSVPMKEDGKDRDGFELEFQSISVEEEEKGGDGGGPSFPSSRVKKEEEDEDDDEGPPPGWDSFPLARLPSEAPVSPQLPSLTPPPPHSKPSADSSGKAQMVCGSCRKLLSYSRGARFVQCSCCQTVNLVLEEHQVGQVKCRGCAVLLMYPFGAPSVQCSSCLFVTKVGVQNKRPPLSLQQGRPKLPAYPVH